MHGNAYTLIHVCFEVYYIIKIHSDLYVLYHNTNAKAKLCN